LLASALTLQGCEIEVEPPAYYDIPAYSWDQPISVENASWQSCHFDSVQNVHVRQLWAFGKNTLRLSEHEHSSTDATCTSNSTLLWRHQYRAADDQKIRVAKGWADINGVETLNGGAPASQDGLGALPAQPDVRRVKWAFSRADAGTGTPSVAPAALLQILFMDISAQPFRLFVGPNSGSKDSEGFPSYLKSFRPLVYVQP
jgi:hypothetical protein